jgi:hypothetical protein
MIEQNSDKSGSQPENNVDVKDVKTDSSTDIKDVNAGSSDADKPWNKDPRFKEDNETFKIGKSMKALMDANNLKSFDDLTELLDSGKKVHGKQVDLDRIEEAFEDSKKLKSYELVWKQQEEERRRGIETPEQTIARLEDSLKKKEAADKHKEEAQKNQQAAQQALKAYDREVQTLVKEVDAPKEQQAFIAEFFGVGNAFNEIDITDKKAIKRLVDDGRKKIEAFKQSVIQDYIKGKSGIPRTSATSGAAPMGDKPKIMLKDARKMLHERMEKIIGG